MNVQGRFRALLRWSERYTKTDMVYLASSGFWLNVQFIVTAAFSLIISVAYANILTKQQFGTYQYVLSIASLLGALTLSGYNTAITRSAARGYGGTLRHSIRPQLIWDLIPAAIAAAIAVWYAVHGADVLALSFTCVAITLPLINAFNSYSAHLSGVQDFKRTALYGIAVSSIYSGLIFLGIAVSPQVLTLVAINFGANAVATWFFYMRTVRRIPVDAPADPTAPNHAWHSSLLNAVSTVAAQIDSVLVFKLLGPVELARYALAKLIPERAGGVLKQLTFSAVMPRFSKRPYQSIRTTLLYRSALVLIVVMVASGAYALAAPFVFRLLYPAYPDAISYSQFYALTFVMYVGALANSALQSHRKFTSLYWLAIGLPIIQIVTQIVGVFTFGLWGLILARVFSSCISAVATLVFALREKGD